MCGCRGLTDKAENSAKRQSLKFSKLEIQQKWKFNKNWKLEIQQIRIYHKKQQNGNPKLHCQEFRCPGEQDFRNATVCPSGTFPSDIPQIWNGSFCTLIDHHLSTWPFDRVKMDCLTICPHQTPLQSITQWSLNLPFDPWLPCQKIPSCNHVHGAGL